MKKVVVLMVAMLLAFTTIVSAKKIPSVALKLPTNLKEVIANEFQYPSFAEDMNVECEVWMKICVTDESTVKIVDLSSTNPELGLYVKNELSSLYVNNPGCISGQVYFLKVKFNIYNK